MEYGTDNHRDHQQMKLNGTDNNNNNNYSRQQIEYPPGSAQYTLPKNLLLTRGFSKVQANEEILNETRTQIENNLHKYPSKNEDCSFHISNELIDYSFMLPDINRIDDYKFKDFLQSDLIELPTQLALSESGHLNWWTQGDWEGVCRPLYPMVTSGDGNCLLHAASLFMWGLHDRYLILRKALHSTLENITENSSPLWRRWKWEQMCQNRKFGLIYNDDEWSKEWKSLLKLSSYQPRISMASSTSNKNNTSTLTGTSSSSSTTSTNQNASTVSSSSSSSPPPPYSQQQQQQQPISTSYQSNTRTSNTLPLNSSSSSINQQVNLVAQDGTVYFESLEEFHVFLLAHILQRPIIIVADTMLHDADGEPLSPIPFGGIYLPFESDINKCYRYPLVLAYDSAHFSALVLMDESDLQIDDSLQTNITDINKKLQNKYPYSVIPITYANKELLPIHFAYDPGPNYDWSKFPHKSASDRSGQPFMSQFQLTDTNIDPLIEVKLSQEDKMFLLQRYMDIVRIELQEPGPSIKRNNLPTNSSGMSVNINNVRVNEPVFYQQSSYQNGKLINSNGSLANGGEFMSKKLKQNTKQTVNNKLQKFLNIFKRNANGSSSLADGNIPNINEENQRYVSKMDMSLTQEKPIEINPSSKTRKSFTKTPLFRSISGSSATGVNAPMQQSANDTIFHKIVAYKNWSSLFDYMNNRVCLLGVKLNLAKPPKFNMIISNYIESTKVKFEMIKQQQHHQQQQKLIQQQQQQQQQKYSVNNQRNTHCVTNRSDCFVNNLCDNCRNKLDSNSNIRSIPISMTNDAMDSNYHRTHYSYNYNRSGLYTSADEIDSHRL